MDKNEINFQTEIILPEANGHTHAENNDDVNHAKLEPDWSLEEVTENTITSGGIVTMQHIKDTFCRGCSLDAWRNRLPISRWLPKYSLLDFRGDLIAGLTVGMTVVPQGLAYADIATVPLEYGLYSAFMGCFVYTLFGTAKDITLGPTAVLSLMTATAVKGYNDEDRRKLAVLLSFYVGIIQVILAVLNLGFLVNFISAPVISGFTTASAFIILYGQVKSMAGLKFSGTSDNIIDLSHGYFTSFTTINGWDTLMGVICFAILLLIRSFKLPKKPMFNMGQKTWSILREIVRTICVTRNALVIIVATVIGYYISLNGLAYNTETDVGLSLRDTVKSGIPTFGLPEFSWGNYTALQTFQMIAPSIPMVTLVAALECIAVAKSFASQFQYRIVPSQELLALGLANVLCSFFKGYPITGSFTRSALNAQSGVRTPMGCTWTGSFVLLAMAVISPAFKFVPNAALAAVIMAAVLVLFEFKIFKDLWLINKKELLSIGVTVLVGLLVGVDTGILVGAGVSLLMLLWPLARPMIIAHFKDSLYTYKTTTDTAGKRVLHVNVTPQGALFFPGAEYIRDFFQDEIINLDSDLQEASIKVSEGTTSIAQRTRLETTEVVFNGAHLTDSDYTSLRALKSIAMACKKANKRIKFVNTDPNVLKVVLPKEMYSTHAVIKNATTLSLSTSAEEVTISKDITNSIS